MLQIYKILVGILFFYLGAAMGSFYNVVVDRLPNDQSIVNSRSECTTCHAKLKWYDLVPIFSFIVLKGKCRYCHTKLSFQYLWSEIITGCLFLLAFLLWGCHLEYAKMFLFMTFWSMLFVVGLMDFKYQIIIDQVLIVSVVIGLIFMFVCGFDFKDILLGALTGFLFYGAIYFITKLILKKEGFGFGDVLFMTAIGCFLGPLQTFLTGILAFYCCLIFIIIFKIKEKRVGIQTEIPFAPSMCVAAFIVSLYGEPMIDFCLRILGFI